MVPAASAYSKAALSTRKRMARPSLVKVSPVMGRLFGSSGLRTAAERTSAMCTWSKSGRRVRVAGMTISKRRPRLSRKLYHIESVSLIQPGTTLVL